MKLAEGKTFLNRPAGMSVVYLQYLPSAMLGD